ncbi:hypothetical protein [Streptosporangium vulgare]|uniref:hypothetical protein n=1 Tax=Streptosporangium vulgare TaxID=46190 RepID=UPI0031D4C5A8
MRAVENGEEFGLRARSPARSSRRSTPESCSARWGKARGSAPTPGVQYDDTINDWHTSPETGRITASNPCSEYLHLDNSSCNLASINLLKFLKDDDTFDIANFVKITELVITAMDVSITFADFPTEKIDQTTRAYRQLGIGYATSGALLMATGHAYDSDGGRAVAGAITSLMTGVSYRRSAELAAVVGPYDGYARNADAHKRVMRKHNDANDSLRTVDEIDGPSPRGLQAVGRVPAARATGNGYRNAQASLLAPTGTIGLMRTATPPASSPTSPWSSSRSSSAAAPCRSSTRRSPARCGDWATSEADDDICPLVCPVAAARGGSSG